VSGIGNIIGWFASLAAANESKASGGGTRAGEAREAVEAVRCFPATTALFIFVLWLLQFMLPIVILGRIFGMRKLTMRAANTQAVLLLGTLFGEKTLKISGRAVHIEYNGRPELELPLVRIAGVEISESWLTQGIVLHSPALPGGRLKLWVDDPGAVAVAIQQAAGGKEAGR
jgi:hypothetical protein